jgi:hypothetical protein
MRLTNYIIDLGRAVAYYPGLKKVTDSTTATILLCQLLYWTDKTHDGWIWKDSNDIEEETGLTYNEQRTARKILLDKGLIQEDYKRLSHLIRFKVCQDKLNAQWEKLTGNSVKEIKTREERKEEKEERLRKEMEQAKKEVEEKEKERKEEKEERDWFVDAVGSERAKKANEIVNRKKEIVELIEKKLTVNISNKNNRWEKFVDFVFKQEKNENRDPIVFLNWALKNGFDVKYWTPEKMITMYPQAFLKNEDFILEDFVKEPPKKKEEKNYAPMPEHLRKKKR